MLGGFIMKNKELSITSIIVLSLLIVLTLKCTTDYFKSSQEVKEEARIEAYNDAYEDAYSDAYNDYRQDMEEETYEVKSDTDYKIMSNDVIEKFTNGKKLAKTGDPKIDGFLSRLYKKVLNGDDYIQFFLDNAESYGIDTSIIDDLIDIDSQANVHVWLDKNENFE